MVTCMVEVKYCILWSHVWSWYDIVYYGHMYGRGKILYIMVTCMVEVRYVYYGHMYGRGKILYIMVTCMVEVRYCILWSHVRSR